MNKQKFDYKEYLKKYIDLYKSKHTKKETIEYIRKIINKDSSVELPSVLADVSLEKTSLLLSKIVLEEIDNKDYVGLLPDILKDKIEYKKKRVRFSLKKIAIVGTIAAITLTSAININSKQLKTSYISTDYKQLAINNKVNTSVVLNTSTIIEKEEKENVKEKKKQKVEKEENKKEEKIKNVLNDYSKYDSVDSILKRQKELEDLKLDDSYKLYDCKLSPEVQQFIYELSAVYGYPVDLTFSIIDTETRGKFDSNGEESYNGPGDYDLGLTQQNTVSRVTEFCKKFNVSYDEAYKLIRDNDYVNLVSAFIEYDEIASHFSSYEPLEYAGCYNGWLNWKNKAISREYVDLFNDAYNNEYTKYHSVVKVKKKK